MRNGGHPLVTPADREDLRDLTLRLFGSDGQGGAIGAINTNILAISHNVEALSNDRKVAEAVAAFEAISPPGPEEIFDHLYAGLTPPLAEQQAELMARLARRR